MAISYETLVVAPRAQEATNFKVGQLNRQESEQPNIAMAQNQQHEQQLNRAGKAEEKSETPFRHDAKDKGSNEYKRLEEEKRKKKEEEEQKKEEELKRMLGCSFDIKV
ncbi:MAG: hypothetical protein K6G60_08190 [Lachnospiraceae bacterium]|nr:hypothetical protein [Lachnospiraceae bacterium]